MNKRFYFTIILSFIFLIIQAQIPDSISKLNSTIVSENYYLTLVDTAVENQLIMLALNGPMYRISQNRIKITELELSKAKNSLLNLLTISAQFNEQTFKQTDPNIFFPKYFFGIQIPLGVIFSQPAYVKTAKEGLKLTTNSQEDLARSMKADIIKKYRQYKLYSKFIEIQSELLNDVVANANEAERNFRKGEILIDEYISAQKVKNDEIAKNLNVSYEQDVIKLEIERMIGVSLDSVIRANKVHNSNNVK